MSVKDKEMLQRAIGIVEGVAFCIPKEAADGLFAACEILYALADKEDEGDGRKSL